MDRIDCPSCGTSYRFETLGVVVPQSPTQTTNVTLACAICKTVFRARVYWQAVKTSHVNSWFRQNVQRKPPKTTHDYILAVQTGRG